MKRIHIVGSGPRTGTTLLAEAMAACFRIDHACEHESSIDTKEPRQGNCLLTKQPGEIAAVRLPLLLNKDLYVICVIRDPRDTIVSFHGTNRETYWVGLRYWRLFTDEYRRLAGHRRFIAIRYEDLASRPDEVQQELMRRLPFLEKQHDFSAFHRVARPSTKSLEALRELRPIQPSGVGNWKNHLPRIKQQIAIHGPISAGLIEFGYEPDASWEACLTDVAAEQFESVLPEHFSAKSLRRQRHHVRKEVVRILLRYLGLRRLIAAPPDAPTGNHHHADRG
ncbi:MAG: sulfotransferase domain-containing protein [Thiobacillus sp.]|nr:sulfotransferase domain-containing protein [Thiobacillus sp.]